jgi:hypothetical protein
LEELRKTTKNLSQDVICPHTHHVKKYERKEGMLVVRNLCVLLIHITYFLTELSPSWEATNCAAISQHYMEPKDSSSPCSQESSNGPYPESDWSSPNHRILSLLINVYVYIYIYRPISSGVMKLRFVAINNEWLRLSSWMLWINLDDCSLIFVGARKGNAEYWNLQLTNCSWLRYMLQVGRSRVRFSMRLVDLSVHLILPAALWPWGRLSL